MANLGGGTITPGPHSPGLGQRIAEQQKLRPRVKPWTDGTYGRDPRDGTSIKTEKEAQDLMDPRTPAGQGLQYWAEMKARQNWEAMIPEFRKRMMRDM